jgi:hypothetical protein
VTKLSDITPRQIEQVAKQQFGFSDPCIICGRLFLTCEHNVDESAERVRYIKNLRRAERQLVTNQRRETVVKSKDELETQADELVAKAEEMLAAAKELRKEASTRYEYPKRPDWVYAQIKVKFRTSQWNTYTYCLFMPRNLPGIFTTGQDDRTTKFKSWTDFIDWLRSDDIIWNSELYRLVTTSEEVKVP